MIKEIIATCVIGIASMPIYASTLIYAFNEPVNTGEWTSYNVSLIESSGWIIQESNLAPTSQQMEQMLSNVYSFEVSMDREAQFFLDNVNFAGLAQSTFEGCTTDSWSITGTNNIGCNSIIGNSPGSVHNGGLPADFFAPEKYLGDMSTAYGGNLSFDLWRNQFSSNELSTASINISTVPVPGAIWLFGSALISLFGFKFRSMLTR